MFPFINKVLAADPPLVLVKPPGIPGTVIEVLTNIVNFLFNIGFILSGLIAIYAAFLFLSSGGNETQIAQAKKTLLWLVLGIAILLVVKSIPALIIDVLKVSSSGVITPPPCNPQSLLPCDQ